MESNLITKGLGSSTTSKENFNEGEEKSKRKPKVTQKISDFLHKRKKGK